MNTCNLLQSENMRKIWIRHMFGKSIITDIALQKMRDRIVLDIRDSVNREAIKLFSNVSNLNKLFDNYMKNLKTDLAIHQLQIDKTMDDNIARVRAEHARLFKEINNKIIFSSVIGTIIGMCIGGLTIIVIKQ